MPQRVTWSHPKVLIALLAVFLAGAAAGAFAMKTVIRNNSANGLRSMRTMDRKELMDYFRRELRLSEEQKHRVETLLEDHFKMLQMLGAQTEEVRLHGRESIAKLLDEEQRKKFDRLMSDWQRSQR
jgi:uncharacterized membrane protein